MWSTTFRHSGHDSDSDSDVDGNNQPESDHARLMREIDLSARHETVEYRPNPWSIARINAACRPPRREPAPAPPPAKPSPKHQPKPIVEAFKRQANRAVRDVRTVPSPDKPCATTTIPGSAHKPPQGCETLRNSAPTRPQCLDVPRPVPVDTPEKRQPAHISTHRPPLEPRRPFSTHTATRSSPVPLVLKSASEVGNVVRNSTLRHSSPGPPSHVPVSALPLVSTPTPPANGQQDHHHGPKTVSHWLLTALHKGLDACPPPPPEPGNHPDPAHTRSPEPKRGHLSPDLSPPPPPKKPRVGMIASRPGPPPASPSRRCPTAYAFGDDADTVWSTTRGTKRGLALANRAKQGGVRQSGRFRLPIAGLTRGMALPRAKPRVITYLPPPKVVGNKATRADTAVEEDIEVRVMGSDVTLVNEDGDDVVVGVDVDEVCAQYPKTRARMKAESRVRRVFGCIVEVQV